MNIYPLKFEPLFKERIWGGRKLAEVFGKPLPADVNIGESWEIADVYEDKSVIANGPLAGMTIDKAIEQYKVEITGNADYHPPFPLLIKLIDAQGTLSVQVHPDADTCKRTGKGDPKTECWYVLEAEPGAAIYSGIKEGTTKEEFAKSIEEGTCADYLNKIEVKVGECYFIPSGLCHAIGTGLLVAEIQQPSDTTYRVFDWNRVDANGNPRQLHIEDGLESIHFEPFDEDLSAKTVGRLVDTDVFKVDKRHQAGNCQMLLEAGQMKVLVILSGSGKITSDKTEEVGFVKGDTILIPAAFEGVMECAEESEYLIATV